MVTTAPEPAPTVTIGTVLLAGEASTYGPGYDGLTAARLPRGTVITICGRGGCETRTVNDYGPREDLFPERIVDLDVPTFEAVCGRPWRRGVCDVTVEYR